MKNQLDQLLDEATATGDVPGVVAIAFDRDGLTYQGAFGERSLGSGVAMTNDTVGMIFSMTKAVTGAAAMQLVERGELDLDAPAGDVCPDLADAQVLTGLEDDGTPQVRPAASPVTLRQLLTHTSGFVYDIWNSDFAAYLAATGKPGVMSLQLDALRVPLMFDPGTRWDYGTGIDWAGQMVEAVSGMTLGQYMQANIFEPLGMHDTGFAPTDAMASRLAGMHARTPDGLVAMELTAPENPEFEMGGGGLLSTMFDYARFCRMVLNDGVLDGNRVMSPETVRLMGTNSMGDLRVTELVTNNPAFSNNAEFFPGVAKTWGLSFQINAEPAPTGRPAGSLSWAGLANSYFWIDPSNGLGGALMTQILPFADHAALDLFYEFETAIYAELG